MNAGNEDAVRASVAAFARQLGPFLSAPEEKPSYSTVKDLAVPPIDRVRLLWEDSNKVMAGRRPWHAGVQNEANGRPIPRLRVSLRIVEGYLRAADAGMADHPYDDVAKEAFDYFLTVQHASGVFGYPINPGHPLEQFASEAKQSGRNVVAGRWLVEDMGTGHLNFDNGVVGAGLLAAFCRTGDNRYLQAARRSAAWASGRPLVFNFNYNSFSAYLLARLYRITGEQRYLDEAARIFRLSVLPGQASTGRWVDQHNAKTVYHSILIRTLGEYLLALKKAGRRVESERVERRLRLALDNLALEVRTYGAPAARGPLQESLPIESLSLGLLLFGEQSEWREALNIYVNNVLALWPQGEDSRRMAAPESLGLYLLYRSGGGGTGIDYLLEPTCAAPTRSSAAA
jgi:hypothetical protein